MMDKLSGKHLPDLTSKEVTKEEAATRLYEALKKECKEWGQNPDYEVIMTSDHTKCDYITEGQIWVCWEAGPYDWGVGYSLGSHPDSYSWPKTNQDWYLETYYGFDVIFSDI